jgi:hypothetical protein
MHEYCTEREIVQYNSWMKPFFIDGRSLLTWANCTYLIPPHSTYMGRVEIFGVYLPSQLEHSLQLLYVS